MTTQSVILSDGPQVLRQGTGGRVTNLLSQVVVRSISFPHPPPDLLSTSDAICTQLETSVTTDMSVGREQSVVPYCVYDVILSMRTGEIVLLPLSLSDKLGCVQVRSKSLPHSYVAVQLISFERHESMHSMRACELLGEAERQKLCGNDLFRRKLHTNAAYHYSMAVKLCILADSEEDCAVELKKVCILNLSACWLLFGEFVRTVCATEKVIELDPNNEKALYRQAVALKQLNELDRAVCNLDRILSLNPSNREAVEEFELIRARRKECLRKEREKYSKLFS